MSKLHGGKSSILEAHATPDAAEFEGNFPWIGAQGGSGLAHTSEVRPVGRWKEGYFVMSSGPICSPKALHAAIRSRLLLSQRWPKLIQASWRKITRPADNVPGCAGGRLPRALQQQGGRRIAGRLSRNLKPSSDQHPTCGRRNFRSGGRKDHLESR